jgi:GTP-binding protein EngB required for normal cell division
VRREQFGRIAVSYLAGRGPLRLCVFIVDARHDPAERDETLRDWLDHQGLPYAIAANKVDALGRGTAIRAVQQIARGLGRSAQAVFGVSAERGAGLDDLWNAIRGAAFAPRESSGRALTDDVDPNPPEAASGRGRH